MSRIRVGFQVTVGALAALLALAFLYFIRPILVLLLISIIFAQAISPLVLQLRRVGARRSQAVLAIYLVIVAGLGTLLWFLFQALATEAGSLLAALPEMQQSLQNLASQISAPALRNLADQVLASASQPSLPSPQAISGQLLGTAVALFEGIFGIFTVLVITFFWISERLVIRATFVRVLPAEQRDRGMRVWDDVEDELGKWVRGQLLLMAIIGLAFAIGLSAMQVKYALLLACFAGIAEIVPLIGPYLGTAPAVLVALTQSPRLAIFVVIFGIVVQFIEGNVLVPRIMGQTTGVSPLTVFLGILIGSRLMGIPGALLAVPIAAGVQVLLTDLNLLGRADDKAVLHPTTKRRKDVEVELKPPPASEGVA